MRLFPKAAAGRPALRVAAVLCLAALSTPLEAQNQGFRLGPVYTDDFPRIGVVLDIARSESGRTREVNPSDLQVVEDGVTGGTPADLQEFRDTGRGMAIVICADVSPAREEALQAIRQALEGLVGGVSSADNVALVTFAGGERVDVPFNSRPGALHTAIGGLSARGGGAGLYRALARAQALFNETPGLPLRRRIVAITAGRNDGSRQTVDDVLRAAGSQPVPIDAIILTQHNPDPRVLQDIDRLSGSTGGNYSALASAGALRATAVHTMEWLQAAPVATFDLKRIGADGASHRVGVRWTQFEGVREASLQAPKGGATGGILGDIETTWLIAAAAAGAFVLLFLILFLVTRRSRQPQPVEPRPTPAPAPSPAPAPVRERTMVEPGRQRPDPAPSPTPDPFPVDEQSTPVEENKQEAGQQAVRRVRRGTEMRPTFHPPTAEKPTAYLLIDSGPHQGERIAIDEVNFWVGGADNNHFQIDDEAVSANHACIQYDNECLYLYDQSRNGTLINGEQVQNARRLMRVGDRLTLGRTVLVLTAAGR
jgi:hypothetical protein